MQVARSSLECRLYIELHPCHCGATANELRHRMVMRDNRLVALYEATCGQCHHPIEYVFALAAEIVAADKFGGAEPSTIIDAVSSCASPTGSRFVVLSAQVARNPYSMARAFTAILVTQ